MSKLWGGRFEKETASSVEAFTESVSYDRRLFRQDIDCNLAHAAMLARCGLITDAEFQAIARGLSEILGEIEAGEFAFDPAAEDVHMNVESALTARIGEAARRLHTARSRNDQVATDMRMWTREAIDEIDGLLADCQRALVAKAEAYQDAIMPGFTHLQHAQPVLLAHALLAYVEMLARDRSRLADARRRVNVSPLGACALAGTTLPIDVEFTAEKLGFDASFENSIDAVSDRDFLVEFVFDLAMVATHLSRLSEEWLIWSSPEFGFVDVDEAFCTGSSIMPQKKNPDVLELVRGKTARVYGALTALLTLLKGTPLAYNRDFQEDKERVFDAFDTVRACLAVLAEMIPGTEFRRERLAAACADGHLDATSLADYLVEKGMPFREAHGVVGRAVRAAGDRPLAALSADELRAFSERIQDDVADALGVENCVARYRSRGSSSAAEVARRVDEWKSTLGD